MDSPSTFTTAGTLTPRSEDNVSEEEMNKFYKFTRKQTVDKLVLENLQEKGKETEGDVMALKKEIKKLQNEVSQLKAGRIALEKELETKARKKEEIDLKLRNEQEEKKKEEWMRLRLLEEEARKNDRMKDSQLDEVKLRKLESRLDEKLGKMALDIGNKIKNEHVGETEKNEMRMLKVEGEVAQSLAAIEVRHLQYVTCFCH